MVRNKQNTLRCVAALGLSGLAVVAQLYTQLPANAQAPAPAGAGGLVAILPVPLDTVPVPMPADLDIYIKDRAAAIKLGKALFWDMQAGSDGITACASCHYQAGADGRDRNQIAIGPDAKFDNGHSVNFQLKLDTHFPFTKFSVALDPLSPKVRSSNDIVGSQGVFKTIFTGITGTAVDAGIVQKDPIYSKTAINTRQVTGRNAPSVINSIFNNRNFWDGRAHNEFNGVNPFGDSDTEARVYETDPLTGEALPVQVLIKDASLASQAVGPVNSDVEMAHGGRNFAVVGKKLLGLKPLGLQKVSGTDSVLGPDAHATKGLTTTYDALIQAAIQDKWWNGTNKFTVNAEGRVVASPTGEYTHMQANMSLIFGMSVLMYESTLISDQTPLDKWLKGDATAMSASAIRGYNLFIGTAGCINCHAGGPLSNATTPVQNQEVLLGLGFNYPAEFMPMADAINSAYDIGYYNIGIRPTLEDLGIGGNDPFGVPLAYARRIQLGILVDDDRLFDNMIYADSRLAVDGAFKTPMLRNVALTGPYMHNGGYATLHEALNNYHRGGDFGLENMPNTAPELGLIGVVTTFDKRDILQFLLELTDPRVEKMSAPFDHPELRVPNGHNIKAGTTSTLVNNGQGNATDTMITVPATGKLGGAPLRRFLGNMETRFFQ